MIELLQLAVETAVREYTAYHYASGLTGLFCYTGLTALTCAIWYKSFKWLNESEPEGFAVVSIVAAIALVVFIVQIHDNATTLLAPKAAAIHQLIQDIR